MSNTRQWWLVGAIVGVLAVPIGIGWLMREQFTPVGVGSDAPEVVATDLEGRDVQLSQLSDQVVLLNIWATWCPPCVQEMPSMQRLYDTIDHPDFEIVAVSIDAELGQIGNAGNVGGNVADFADRFGLSFTIWRDPDAHVQRSYSATAVPESFLIDRSGQIVKKVVGATEWDSEANVDLIRRLLDS